MKKGRRMITVMKKIWGIDSEGESERPVSVMTFQNFGELKQGNKRKAAGGEF